MGNRVQCAALIGGFISVLFCISAMAWNHTGHLVIAQIAYDHLTPEAKKHVDQLSATATPDHGLVPAFVASAVWMDNIKAEGVQLFNQWHYIDYPWYPQGSGRYRTLSSTNAVSAILQTQKALAKYQTDRAQAATFLRILIHVVGDIHQPLHAISVYSPAFPRGDKGGNLFLLKVPEGNLHAYWDSGLGVFSAPRGGKQNRLLRSQRLAMQLQHQYPQHYFGDAVNNGDPKTWAKESYGLAKTVAYDLPEKSAPSPLYIANGQKVAEQQVVLAGYRLARVVNGLFDPGGTS